MNTDYQNQQLTTLLGEQIPDYVQQFYPLFVIFVTKYFEFLETSSTSVQTTLQQLQLQRDIDTTASNLVERFLNTYVPELPNSSALDSTMLVKFFREFYQRKGSEDSFKFFFRSFFADDIEVLYPRDRMFRTSAGDWYVGRSLRVNRGAADRSPELWLHTQISGNSSQATAVVDSVSEIAGLSNQRLYELVMSPGSVQGSFVSGETITGTYYPAWDDSATTTANITFGLTAAGPLVTETGLYRNTRSQLSLDQVLQDSLYFQQFSYVIRTREDRAGWADSVLKMIHPAGTVLFNEVYSQDMVSSASTSNFVRSFQNETSVRIPVIKTFLDLRKFGFDRVGDLYTGTSNTLVATSTGFTTVAYSSIGNIVYDQDYDYPGENITWALMRTQDNFGFVTEMVRTDGATFDKDLSTVDLDTQVINWPLSVNTSTVNTRLVLVSSIATANTALLSFSSNTLSRGTTGMILLITWMKNAQGNSPAGESNNTVVLTFSSTASVVPYFDEDYQNRYKRIALGRSLEYNNLVYYHSSNSIQSINSSLTSGSSFSSWNFTTSTGQILFKPYNWERGVTYDRVAIWFEVDQDLQLNTSITELFENVNLSSTSFAGIFSATGLITTGQGIYVSSSATYGFSTSVTGTQYTFSSGAVVFNADTNSSRFVRSRTFGSANTVTVNLRYIVGDSAQGNQGDVPDANETLILEHSFDGGSSWTTSTTIWNPSNFWSPGCRILTGTVQTTAGDSRVTGSGTLFGTDTVVGDRLSFGGSSTASTAYTITSIISNNEILVSPTPVNNTSTATVFFKVYTRDQWVNTSVTVYNSASTSTSVTVQIRQNLPGSTALNNDLYAIDNFGVDVWRLQSSSAVINFGLAVSSGTGRLNIRDTDFFNVTTIGA